MMTTIIERSRSLKGEHLKMIIKDLFKKDIDRSIQGVVTIGNEDEEQKWQELEEYVCTDEITRSFRTFFRRYSGAMPFTLEFRLLDVTFMVVPAGTMGIRSVMYLIACRSEAEN